MAEILKRTEDIPASYPPIPSGLSAGALGIDGDVIWARIEAYTAYRWSERSVVWVVRGPGIFAPDLAPATISSTEIWETDSWTPAVLSESWQGGYVMLGDGPYRFTGLVGGGAVPAEVFEAFRRTAEYLAEANDSMDRSGASAFKMDLGSSFTREIQRNPAWKARALQNSGAADILRRYRRA